MKGFYGICLITGEAASVANSDVWSRIMKQLKVSRLLVLVLAAGLVDVTSARADSPDSAQITPVGTVAPNLFAAGQLSNTCSSK